MPAPARRELESGPAPQVLQWQRRNLPHTMPSSRCRLPWFAGGLLVLPAASQAHFFTQPYVLPVPFAMYAYGAAAALLASFAVIGLLRRQPAGAGTVPTASPAGQTAAAAGRSIAAAAAVGLLLLCIVAGFVGTQNPFGNISMTLFWIVFVLGMPYAVALLGDFYAPLNPWRTLVDWTARLTGIGFEGRWPGADRLGCLPALLLYMGFIWLELFAQLSPRGLSVALLAYTAINLAGAWLLGQRAWFRGGEFFGVMLHLVGQMSPWSRGRWRMPFAGLIERPARDVYTVVFILFMLSSTAFDGLHSTVPWTQVFWKSVYPGIAPWFPAAPGKTYVVSVQLYYAWQWLWLLCSPVVYLLVFAGFVALTRGLTGSTLPTRALLLHFAKPLVPIAFVYHVTHYYTLLLAQGGQLARLVSDPFGLRWNLFGTAGWNVPPLMLDMPTIWHTQVALIVVGHIVSVYLAHLEALKVFGTPRRAVLSQLPMLGLMMLFTTLGLWILSMPIASGS